MKIACSFFLATLASSAAAATGDCQIAWNTGWTNYSLGASDVSTAEDREVADDFDFNGAIGRIQVEGYGPFNGTYPIDGVWVRFYAWTANGPGALQNQRFLAQGDPHLHVASIPETVDVVLAQPFVASGKHYLSVQVDFAPSGGYWWPWTGGNATPLLSRAWVRDNLAGGGWTSYSDPLGLVDRDMSFTLFTAPSGAQCSEWSEVAAPAPSPDYTILRDLTVINANDVWAVGHFEQLSPGANEQMTLAMHYDGNGWSVTPTPSPAPAPGMSNDYLWSVDALAPNDVWAAGEQNMVVPGGWVGPQPLALHWNGSSWSEVTTPIPPTSIGAGYSGSSVLEVEAIATNDVWFLGRWVGPYPNTNSTRPAMAMHWDGASIQLVDTPVLAGTQQIHAADAFASNEIWAVGSMTSPNTSYPYVLRWNGSVWSQVLVPPAGTTDDVYDVAVLAPNDVWISATRIVGTASDEFLLHWNGTNWSQSATPIVGPMLALAADDIWIAGNDLHHWDGSSWSVTDAFGCIPWPAFGALDGSGSTLWAAGRQLTAGLLPLTVRFEGPCSSFAYCTAGTTSNGCVPAMASIGTASASASNGFTLQVSSVEGLRAGLIFYGASGQVALPWASGSTSFLCVKPPTQRMGVQNSGGTLGSCNGTLAQDWNAFMAANVGALGQPRVAGASFDAQSWFRDPPAPKTTNLSNAVHFTLAP